MSLKFAFGDTVEAVNFLSGNLLIVASAGTGKTTTIVERYINLIKNHGYKPEEILMTTFTNKAAKDMTKKIIEKTGSKPPYIGTMHSIFLKIIRSNTQPLSLNPKFTLIHEESDKKKIIKKILKIEKIDPKTEIVKYFVRWISKFKNRGILAENLSEDLTLDDNIEKGIIEETMDDEIIRIDPRLRGYVNKVYKKYEDEMKKLNSIDLDDILLLTFKLLNQNENIRSYYSKKFKSIMVDEAQDLNVVQKNILNLLKNNNLCLIGDDCQNIYEWRGSSNELVFDFNENENTVFLKENYRSDKNIIKCINKIINSMKFKIDKKLICTKNNSGNIAINSFFSFNEETEFIAYEIKKLLNKKVTGNQIAVLFRTNRIGKEIERELKKNKIPCHLSKAKDFFEREEIKDIISFLRLKINHQSIYDFQRILILLDGMGQVTVGKFVELSQKEKCSILESLKFARDLKLNLHKISQINKLRSILNNFEKNPIYLFLNDFGYKNRLSKKYNDEKDKLQDKFENIQVLIELFKEYKPNKEDINQFLDDLIKLEEKDKNTDKVTLSTIHTAKGLEWEHVFLISCNERILPFYIREELNPIKRDSELRLFYVAVSRAKNSLIITHYETDKTGREIERSQFLDILEK